MEQATLVPNAGEAVLESVKVDGHGLLLMMLRASGEQNLCPQCHRSSTRVHSHYQRKLRDLPWEGIPVRIQLHVRRFFCDTEGCGQRIFTERLPNTVHRYARRTCRLSADDISEVCGVREPGHIVPKVVGERDRVPKLMRLRDWCPKGLGENDRRSIAVVAVSIESEGHLVSLPLDS